MDCFQLKPLGRGWVNLQVKRRTRTILMRELKVDPKPSFHQMGHCVDDGGSTKKRAGETVTSLVPSTPSAACRRVCRDLQREERCAPSTRALPRPRALP
jgi:hypothetical protein